MQPQPRRRSGATGDLTTAVARRQSSALQLPPLLSPKIAKVTDSPSSRGGFVFDDEQAGANSKTPQSTFSPLSPDDSTGIFLARKETSNLSTGSTEPQGKQPATTTTTGASARSSQQQQQQRMRNTSILNGDSSIFSSPKLDSKTGLFSSPSGDGAHQRARLLTLKKADPFEQVLGHVENIIYYIEMGCCPPAKKVPAAFVDAVNEARERELWAFPTGRVRDSNGNKLWTRVTLPDGTHALGHEADEPAEVPKFPVSVPIENNVLTQHNHPTLVALRENNLFAKRKKAPPKNLPGANFLAPTGVTIGQGDMNWDGVLRSVCLTQLGIGASLCKRVGRAMILNHTVLTLDLSECNLADAGCAELCASLARNDTLKVLNVSGNHLTPASGEPIAQLIRAPRSPIVTLFAACNRLGNETAIAIARVLCDPNTTLEFLNLRGNSIDDIGAKALFAASQPSNNSTLTALWLQLNLVSNEVLRQVNQLMEQKCPKEILRALEPKKKKSKNAKGGGNNSANDNKAESPATKKLTSASSGTTMNGTMSSSASNDAESKASTSRGNAKRSR